VTSFVEAGLKDLSVSRTTVSWGISFPHDPEHTIYVWVEALANYISAIGYGQAGHEKEFNAWWPADLHILGKDIVRFHAVYWPALLMAARLPLPKQLLVHGWIKINKQKMSKSLGNVIDPIELQQAYGVEAVRYYLLRYISVNQDGEFSTADLERAIDTDLANDLSNLLNRMLSLAEQHGLPVLESPRTWDREAAALQAECHAMVKEVAAYMAEYQFHMALARIWHTIKMINTYFHGQEPWKQIKSDRALGMHTLAATAHSLRMVAVVLSPVMPQTMRTLLSALGIASAHEGNSIENLQHDTWQQVFTLTKIPYLFERRKVENIMEQKPDVGISIEQESYISIDEFKKAVLVVGTVQECQVIAESDRLLKLQVDFGSKGVRQILTGMKKFYQPEELTGKQLVFILNLAPRKIMGYESRGMLLTVADEQGKPQLVTPGNAVQNGAHLQ